MMVDSPPEWKLKTGRRSRTFPRHPREVSFLHHMIQTLHWSRPPSLAIKMQDKFDAGAVFQREHEGVATLSGHILGSTRHPAT